MYLVVFVCDCEHGCMYLVVCVSVCVCVCVCVVLCVCVWTGGCDSRMGRCWLWGAGPPQSAQCSSGLSTRPFCVEFACSPRVHKGFPPLITPTEKHANRTILSVPDRDGRFIWSPGAEKLPTAPGGSWRRDDPGWVKGREKIHADLRPACVCVCSVSWLPPYIYITRVCCCELFVQ